MASSILKVFHDWEIEEVVVFLQRLQLSSVKRDEEDRMGSKENKCGKFSVKSLYFYLAQ